MYTNFKDTNQNSIVKKVQRNTSYCYLLEHINNMKLNWKLLHLFLGQWIFYAVNNLHINICKVLCDHKKCRRNELLKSLWISQSFI